MEHAVAQTDAEKLRAWADAINNVPVPMMDTEAGETAMDDCILAWVAPAIMGIRMVAAQLEGGAK